MATNSKTFRIFVCSTFSDLVEERNALQEQVFPRLRELCAQHEVRFQAIDLRWGVSQQASVDQQTMNICLGEIERCHEITPRPNFIVLLGDRYGWCPPPSQIPAEEFERILEHIRHEDRILLECWYLRDDNALPAEYILQPWTEYSYAAWGEIERSLLEALVDGAQRSGLDEEAQFKYWASATHQEIAAGVLQVEDASEHVFCFFRSIEELPKDRTPTDYLDLSPDGKPDPNAKSRLHTLKNDLCHLLPGNVHEYKAKWIGEGVCNNYLDSLCEDVYKCLSRVIQEEVSRIETVDPLDAEIDAHETFGKDRAQHFTGRAKISQKIQTYTGGSESFPLAIWGVSGSGKSALIAKAVEDVKKDHPDTYVISRFIGATPNSSDGVLLLKNLCRQIYSLFNFEEEKQSHILSIQDELKQAPKGEIRRRREARWKIEKESQDRVQQIEREYAIPEDYTELALTFQRFIKMIPSNKHIVFFLDGLDQLSNTDDARSLSWLPNDLPEGVRFVISTSSGECLQGLEKRLPKDALVEMEPFKNSEAEKLLDHWLGEAKRILNLEQRNEVLTKFAGCPLPLYLRLAFEDACRWKSYTPLSKIRLSPDIPGLIRGLFERLSDTTHHGEILVSRSLGYLEASKNGLTEDELLDVLSNDIEVYVWFLGNLYHTPPDLVEEAKLYLEATASTCQSGEKKRTIDKVDAECWLGEVRKDDEGNKLREFLTHILTEGRGLRLPIVVWSRLYFDLKPYLMLWSRDSTQLMGFYHRQFGEVVAEHYLYEEVKEKRHYALARYFDAQETEMVGDDGQVLNIRKLSELPYQQTYAKCWDKLEDLLTDFDFIHAKVEGIGTYPLILDYKEVESTGLESEQLCLIREALLLSLDLLSEDPSQIATQLTGRLLSFDFPRIQDLLKKMRNWNRPWLRPLTPSLNPPGGPLAFTLRGHKGVVNDVAITPDGRKAVSASEDGTLKVWDLNHGLELETLMGHTSRIMGVAITPDGTRAVSTSRDATMRVWDLNKYVELVTIPIHNAQADLLAVTPDGRSVACALRDKTIKVWDLEEGIELVTLTGHNESVVALALTPDGRKVISAYWDMTLKIWDLNSGVELGSLIGHASRIVEVAAMSNGLRAISASHSRLKIWDLEKGTEINTLAHQKEMITAFALSPSGTRAALGFVKGTVKIWDVEEDIEIKTYQDHAETITAVAFTPDGKQVLSASKDQMLKVWDADKTEYGQKHSSDVTIVKVSPAGEIAITSDSIGIMKVWDLKTGTELFPLTGHRDLIMDIAFTSDGQRAITASRDKTLKVWDLGEGVELATLTGHKEGVSRVVVTNDGRKVISITARGKTKLWDLKTGLEISTLSTRETDDHLAMPIVSINPDVDRLAIKFSGKNPKIWDLASGKVIQTIHQNIFPLKAECTAMTFTPDSRHLILAHTGLGVWDLETGKKFTHLLGTLSNAVLKRVMVRDLDGTVKTIIAPTQDHVVIRKIAISRDGKRVVTSHGGGSIGVWDLEAGTEPVTIIGHSSQITALSITMDGSRAISMDLHGHLKVWDLNKYLLLANFTADRGCYDASPDCESIVVGDKLGQVHFLKVEGVKPSQYFPLQQKDTAEKRKGKLSHEKAARISERNREILRAQNICKKGKMRYLDGNLEDALVFQKEAEHIYRQVGDQIGLQEVLKDQAMTLKEKGDLNAAFNQFQEQVQICRELGRKDDLFQSLFHQACIRDDQGQIDEALALLQEHEEISQQYSPTKHENLTLVHSLLVHATLLMKLGDNDSALEKLRKMEDLCLQLSRGFDLGLRDIFLENYANAKYIQAVIYGNRGMEDQALKLLQETEEFGRKFEFDNILYNCLKAKAQIFTNQGKHGAAKELQKEIDSLSSQ
jgi:WD40 repeat protein/tetratricopeptide (TPR) repeat protein